MEGPPTRHEPGPHSVNPPLFGLNGWQPVELSRWCPPPRISISKLFSSHKRSFNWWKTQTHTHPWLFNSSSGVSKHWLCICVLCEYVLGCACEAGSDLGPFAALLAPGHTSLEQQNTEKLYRTKNNCVQAQLGKFWIQKIQRDQKTQLPLLRSLG